MKNSVLDFYNELSESYHLIFNDWYHAVSWQGEVLNNFIRSQLVHCSGDRIDLLDASCGIGTQSLGLALHDFNVTATDISPKSVERAKKEAKALGVKINFGVADLRSLEKEVLGQFNVVLSADNAIPHLLTDDDLKKACSNLYSKLLNNGLLLLTIRDYDDHVEEQQRATLPRVMDEGKRIVFQVWDWVDDGKIYITKQFIMQELNGEWKMKVKKTSYRALLRDELSEILRNVGFFDIKWHMSAESGYYQPIVTARK